MKTRVAILALLGVVRGASAGAAGALHPVEKVIKLIQDLSEAATSEGKKETLTYQKFEKWCADSEKTLAKAIESEKQTMSALENEAASKEQLAATLTREIATLEAELGEHAAADANAKAVRTAGKDLWDKANEDLSATIKAVQDAITALDAAHTSTSAVQLYSKPAVHAALALLEASELDAGKRAGIAALLQAGQRPDLKAEGDLEGHVQKYGFKSNNVIELLKELQAKFEEQLLTATKEETNALNEYALSKQARDAAVKLAEGSKDQKTKESSDASAALAEYRSSLKDTQEDLAADSSSLASTRQGCLMKKQEWEDRSSVRAQELEALKAAEQILSKATGVRTEAPQNPVPPPAPVEATSFLQIKDPRSKAIDLLLAAAQKTHSHALERMAQELSVHLAEEPFAQVNNAIEKMIFHLMDEQKDEDTHKLWCDQELSKANISKANKEQRKQELFLEIQSAEATVALLTKDIEEAQAMVAEITAFVAEATDIRKVGKQENAEAIKDAQDAQAALADATAVLEAFYKSSGAVSKEAWEFVQKRKQPVELPTSPATWDSSYTKVSDPQNQPSGILSVLKKTAAEFAAMEADTKAQEITDEKAFQEEMKTSAIEKARRTAEIEVKNQEKGRLVDKVASLSKVHKEVSDELEAVEQYLKDLEPACVNGDSTYEERKAARTTEMDALKQAQVILRDAFKEEEAPPPPAALAAVKSAPSRKFLEVSPHSTLT